LHEFLATPLSPDSPRLVTLSRKRKRVLSRPNKSSIWYLEPPFSPHDTVPKLPSLLGEKATLPVRCMFRVKTGWG
jgi:hypothetical protein